MKALSLVRYVAWAAVAALAIISGLVLLRPGSTGNLGASAIGVPFDMQSAAGGSVDSASLKGKPYAVFFGFTQCPDICPTTMFEMSQNLKALDGDPAFAARAKDFRVYFVTVDPERDTPEILKQYLSAFDPRIIGLIPKDQDELARVAKGFRVFYRKVPTKDGYTMDHSASVLLFNADAQWTGTLDSQESDTARLAKLRRLLKTGPSV